MKRWRRLVQRRRRDERGVVIVLVALLITSMMVLAAIVLDLGVARSNAIASQADADMAALAGGRSLGNRMPRTACEEIVRNAATNLPELASVSPTDFCSPLPVSSCSSPGTTASPSTTAGRVTLRLTYPVSDAAIADPSVPGSWVNDGTACQRMKIDVTVDAPTTFAKVLGVDNLAVTRSATVRGTVTAGGNMVPALWLLDPTGCTPLNVTGGSKVTVGVAGATPIPGLIAIDSDGSTCGSNQVTISASGAGTTLDAVPSTGTDTGKIMLHALPAAATTCSPPACSQSDVTNGRLSPMPERANDRATRAPVDWRYDCKSTYPSYNGITIPGCPSGAPSYMTRLRTAIGSSGQPTGFSRWSSTHSCNPSGTITVTGNWWIDCTGGLAIGNGTTLTFSGGNVVFDRALKMTGGQLNFNTNNPTASLPASCVAPAVTTPCTTSSSAMAAFVYVRTGEWSITGGELRVNRAAVIMDSGYLQVNGSPPNWSAPTEGPFSGLSYWSELNSNKFSMAGGAGATVSGAFFTPEARPFTLTGGGTWGQQSAQFISFQLTVSGGGTLSLAPDKELVGLAAGAGMLIR